MVASIILLAFESLVFVQLVYYIMNIWRNKQKNLYNNVAVVMLTLTIFMRLSSLLYSIIWDEVKDVPEFTLQFYFSFQLPFDTLNLVVIAGFFQWIESLYALKSTVELNQAI